MLKLFRYMIRVFSRSSGKTLHICEGLEVFSLPTYDQSRKDLKAR